MASFKHVYTAGGTLATRKLQTGIQRHQSVHLEILNDMMGMSRSEPKVTFLVRGGLSFTLYCSGR
jgi:hypothetical protein